jgi:hypothetical protein
MSLFSAPRFAKKRNRIPAKAKNNQEFFPSEKSTRGEILIILLRFGRTVMVSVVVFYVLLQSHEKSRLEIRENLLLQTTEKTQLSLFLCTDFLLFLKRDLIDDESRV